MPSATNPALIATAAQTRAAGSYLIGRRNSGGVDVDALHDVASFVTLDANGRATLGGAAANYRFNVGEANPARGILADFTNIAGAGLNGAMISFTQNTIANMCFGMAPGAADFAWYANRNGAADGIEIMRLKSNGDLGLGVNPSTRLHVKRYDEIMRLETAAPRNTTIDHMSMYDPTGRKGYWGWNGNLLEFNNELEDGIFFSTNGVPRWQIGGDGHLQPLADNAYTAGRAANRISAIYLASNPIVTSDVRLKFYRAEPAPTLDEHAAILECFEAFGFFQHLDAIERETAGGSPARWHFGPKAQALWAIFASHGLAAALGEHGLPPEGSVPPAFLCFDAWDEETAPVMAWWKPSDILGPDGQPIMVPCAEGEEGTEQRPTGETMVTREAGNIFGVRIDQLQSLMLVALNTERKLLAARVAALEPAA